jgi:hypothetical protein
LFPDDIKVGNFVSQWGSPGARDADWQEVRTEFSGNKRDYEAWLRSIPNDRKFRALVFPGN